MKLSIIVRLAIAIGILLALGVAPALAECDGEVIELEFMNWWGAAREALMDTLIGHFEAENPCIKVINQVQPWDNRAELLTTAAASSNPPGIIMSTRPETYQFAINGLIVPRSIPSSRRMAPTSASFMMAKSACNTGTANSMACRCRPPAA